MTRTVSALQSMAERSERPGVATDLARQASSKSYDIASWPDSREAGHLVQELQAFAGAFPTRLGARR